MILFFLVNKRGFRNVYLCGFYLWMWLMGGEKEKKRLEKHEPEFSLSITTLYIRAGSNRPLVIFHRQLQRLRIMAFPNSFLFFFFTFFSIKYCVTDMVNNYQDYLSGKSPMMNDRNDSNLSLSPSPVHE
jgi:hypothetical protein